MTINKSLHFFVQGKVKGKERPRFSSKTNRFYTPHSTHKYEYLIQTHSLKARNEANIFSPLKGTISVEINLYFKNKKYPDLDNCIKCILDGMNGIIYEDDRQVNKLTCCLYYNSTQEGAAISINSFEN